MLYRHHSKDELELAEAWNEDRLVRVDQDALYTDAYAQELNRLLSRRRKWLIENVFSRPVG